MLNIIKTELGIQVLKDRSIPLTAKQRQLLVLINAPDQSPINTQLIEKLATAEVLNALREKGLIEDTKQPVMSLQAEKISEQVTLPQPHIESQTTEPTIEFQILDFDDVKLLMCKLLQQHCGLMAKQLIQRIQLTEDIHQLTKCRMQWITHLQESKIQPLQLNQHLQQINFALTQLKEDQFETL